MALTSQLIAKLADRGIEVHVRDGTETDESLKAMESEKVLIVDDGFVDVCSPPPIPDWDDYFIKARSAYADDCFPTSFWEGWVHNLRAHHFSVVQKDVMRPAQCREVGETPQWKSSRRPMSLCA